MGWLFGKKRDTQDASEMLRRYNEAEAARLEAMTSGGVPSGEGARTVSSSSFASGGELPVEDVFTITGRGRVVTGVVSTGTLRVGDGVIVLRGGSAHATSRITAIEMFRKTATEVSAGTNAGLVLSGKVDVARGDVIRVDPSA